MGLIKEIGILKQPSINDGALELIKWLAVIIMVIDHYNKYIYNGTVEPFFQLGRLAMPLFGIVFAYNLARPHIDASHLTRIIIRLLVVALIAQVPFYLLGHIAYGWFPVNILFLFLVSALIIQQFKINSKYSIFLSLFLFISLGFFVEYAWFGVAVVISAWFYFEKKQSIYLIALTLSCLSLVFINSNYYAVLALPLFFILARVNIKFPRWRNAFYVFYPGHLFILYLL